MSPAPCSLQFPGVVWMSNNMLKTVIEKNSNVWHNRRWKACSPQEIVFGSLEILWISKESDVIDVNQGQIIAKSAFCTVKQGNQLFQLLENALQTPLNACRPRKTAIFAWVNCPVLALNIHKSVPAQRQRHIEISNTVVFHLAKNVRSINTSNKGFRNMFTSLYKRGLIIIIA